MSHDTSERLKKWLLKSRRWIILGVGLSLFAVSVLLQRNAQLEGLFFGLLTATLTGGVTHYSLKLSLTAMLGRVWCGWACWTGALLDQLPYRKGAVGLPGAWRLGRVAHLGLSFALVIAVLFFGGQPAAIGSSAVAWFVIGNLWYWAAGVALAVVLRDNRAFCKYLCPVAVPLHTAARSALLNITGDADACQTCASQACTSRCPMDIDIPAYISAHERLPSSECILCAQCVAICPPNTLRFSIGADHGGLERLEKRVQK